MASHSPARGGTWQPKELSEAPEQGGGWWAGCPLPPTPGGLLSPSLALWFFFFIFYLVFVVVFITLPQSRFLL